MDYTPSKKELYRIIKTSRTDFYNLENKYNLLIQYLKVGKVEETTSIGGYKEYYIKIKQT